MTLAQFDFRCEAGADWQRQIKLVDPGTGFLVGISTVVMEIRSANFQLALRLDQPSGRAQVLQDGATISLHIPASDSAAAFAQGTFPGTYQAIGYWGIGRAYLYDLLVNYTNGVQDRIMKGFFYVDPNVTQFTGVASLLPSVPVPPPLAPALSAVTPNSVVSGAATTLVFTGTGFLDITGAYFDGPNTYTVGVTVDSQIQAHLTIPVVLTPGAYLVSLSNPGGYSNVLPFTVTGTAPTTQGMPNPTLMGPF